MFHLVLLLAFVYVAVRFVAPLPWSLGARIALGTVLLLISKHHLIQHWVYGNMFSPEVPRLLILVVGVLFCTFGFLFVFVVSADCVLLAARLAKRAPVFDAHTRTRARYVAAAVALLLSAGAVTHSLRVPDVKRVELTMRDLPPELDGFRVVQLTDLHSSRLLATPWVRGVVERTNALNPDLILFTGDVIDGTPDARREDVRPLGDLRAKHGVIAALGNHEYYFDGAKWTAEFEALGMKMLLNRHVSVEVNGQSLIVAGVTDPVARLYGMDVPNIEQALAGVPANAPIILLSHRPVRSSEHAKAGVDLQLSGHTHGGVVLGLTLVVMLANDGFLSGAYDIDGMWMYISNGTGMWNGFPIRLGVPAEITEIVLRSPGK
ncbi:metallophosphoesterase [Pigmentiphaga aceris]|uniref:Metallophosphoesterase n=1 Tax=Pigmentiphaga aceris TaxID=1940612 RepID=A0A5C0AY26_9BURK|nr:metallophosphoesterase [Pigmentiphaga aceris]QEI06474.1 metallophosphoesterase [Pigmentiphaga aceris]